MTYALYRDLVAAAAKKVRAEVWAYCLMPKHVHPIVTPTDADARRMGDARRFLAADAETDALMAARVAALERAASIGRPVGNVAFIAAAEADRPRPGPMAPRPQTAPVIRGRPGSFDPKRRCIRRKERR